MTRALNKTYKIAVSDCAYCGCRVFPTGSAEEIANPWCRATRDHVEPKIVRFCQPNQDNIVIACYRCNSIKSHYPVAIFVYFLALYGGTERFNHTEFRRFVCDLAMAGFRLAKLSSEWAVRPKPARDERGRFVRRPA